MVRKTVHRTENNYLLLQSAMLETRLQTPHDGTEDGAAPYAGDAGIALVAGKTGILHLFRRLHVCIPDGLSNVRRKMSPKV